MLIFRYLARDLIGSTLAVCTVLLMVIVSGRFVKYLAQAAAGKLDPSVLLAVIGYRMPGFLELVLPLAFFLGVLLTYGRLYVQSEMSVMMACGMSQKRLVAYTMVPALLVAAVVAWLSLFVAPSGIHKAESLLTAQKQRGELDSLSARRFHPLHGGRAITYTESVDDQGLMTDVFLAENNPEGKKHQLVLVVAASGHQENGEGEKDSYLVLNNGYRIQGTPGQADYRVTQFEEYGQRLKKSTARRRAKVDAMPTSALRGSDVKAHQAAMHWRFSVPVLVLIVTLLAVPMSRTNPRRGRFAQLLPAVLLYVLYLVALNGVRGVIEDGKVEPLAMWGVHLLFLLIALLLFFLQSKARLFKRNHATVAHSSEALVGSDEPNVKKS